MDDILFGNNNQATINRLAKRSYRANKQRNVFVTIALFLTAFMITSVFSLGCSYFETYQMQQIRAMGTTADVAITSLSEEQYVELSQSGLVSVVGVSQRLGSIDTSGMDDALLSITWIDETEWQEHRVPTISDIHGDYPQAKNEIMLPTWALRAMGIDDPQIGMNISLSYQLGTDYQYISDEFVLSGYYTDYSASRAGNRGAAYVSELFATQTGLPFDSVSTAMISFSDDSNALRSCEKLKRKISFTESQSFEIVPIAQSNSTTIVLPLAAIIVFIIISGYLLIYNIFDISVMQDVRQYGLLRMIGTSTRQIKSIVNRQAVWLTLIGLPIGLIAGFFAGRALLPVVMEIFSYEYSTASLQVSASPMLFVIAALFTILTVFISTRKPAKKASKVSPMEAIRYTEQDDYKKKTVTRISGAKLSHMAFSNLGRNRRRCVFIVVSMLLCIVLFNSIIIVTQSMDEEKWITRTTKTDFTVYNSIAVNVQEGFRHHEDALPQQVVDMIREQNGLEEERYLYRNTVDDGNVLVDYGFEGLTCTNTFEYENGISKSFGNYALNTAPDAENLFFGNVYGASEHFWSDMMIYDGETDPNVLKQKMLTGEYVIIGNRLDRLSGGPKTTSLSEQLQIGDSISFYRDGELVKTCTILAKACTVGTEDETPTTTTATMHIGGDAPFVYLPDTVFKQIYTTPTLLNYGFNMDASLHPQMEDFLSSYVEKNPSVTYTSTKLLKEQLNSVASMVWVVGSLIGCIMALAGLINFTNMIITNIITRRHEFATMQSIGMTNRQLQRLMVYEGVYYAAGADIIGGVVALLLAVTVLKNVLNSPSMWFFTLHITLVPALVIGVLYLLLAAVIPLIVLHFFNKGTVVERLRTSE